MASTKVVMKFSDGESIEVDEAVARHSPRLAKVIDDGTFIEHHVPLSDVNSETLAKVIQYCEKHVEAAATKKTEAVDEELKTWDADFVKMDEYKLLQLMEAALILEIKELIALTSVTYDDMININIKTPKDIHKKVVLKCSDGESIEVDEAVARHSLKLAKVIDDGTYIEHHVPFKNVRSETLAKVIQYCEKHVEAAATKKTEAVDEELKTWDADFVKMDNYKLLELNAAADFLEIQKLSQLICQTVTDTMDSKTAADIRKEYPWAFK